MKTSNPQTFSIVIPTYNRGLITLNTLEALAHQTKSGFPVIIVDQSESPVEALQEFQSSAFLYQYIHIDTPGLPNARNVGMQAVTTDYAIFLDDDCIPDPDLIEAYQEIFISADDALVLVGGRVIEEGSNIFKERISLVGGVVTRYGKTLKNFDTDNSGPCEWVPGGNFCVRTDIYKKVGGFDTNFIGTAVMEDSDFGYTILNHGYSVQYNPKPRMLHLRIPTGGVRPSNPSRGMNCRTHNTIYFFRKHGRKKYIPFTLIYLSGILVKEIVARRYSLSAIYYTFLGFIRGIQTPLRTS